MHAMLDANSSDSSSPQELSIDQNFKYQFPGPEGSKYLVNKTVIF